MLISGETGVIFIISAVVSSLFVSFISCDLLFPKKNTSLSLKRILRLIKYSPWLMWQIILANVDIVYRTLHPSMPIDPHMIEFDTDLKTDTGITILANSITLTPGTVTVVAHSDGKFLVHAISRAPADGLLAGAMQAKVKKIEGAED
jgi:multicomponent Na+:H+ antiporter subunit E